jgi:hypothetical protein
MIYYFYARLDKTQEPITRIFALSRLKAARHFAARKNLDLKAFLAIYGMSR